MTRIIAGFAGSLALAVPKSGTRPTSDRVREAVFSALEAADLIAGARVLDLYAGSGALGLEAASRGAAVVRLVEREPRSADVARRNAARVMAAAPATARPHLAVDTAAVRAWLDAAGSGAGWDVAFLDPPYDLGEEQLADVLARLVPLLADDATVVVERSTRSPAPTLPEGLTAARRRDYGETAVHWLHAD